MEMIEPRGREGYVFPRGDAKEFSTTSEEEW
jgi:hypothetical protein